MMRIILIIITTIISLSKAQAPESSSANCRCIAGESCFPSSGTWAEFNRTIGGTLTSITPPAEPCYSPQNTGQCNQARSHWTSSIWRSNQPGAAQHPNWEAYTTHSCPLPRDTSGTARRSCEQGSVPLYAVAATSAADIQAAILFATQHRLRLVVKNTGHDYLGRGFARGSFSIWTHGMKGISFISGFRPERCPARYTLDHVVEAQAGVQWRELYRAVHRRNRTIVGGLSASLGSAGGYVLGGGHSVLSPWYGLAADNVLQFHVVTADGTARYVSQCSDPALFWALRGGGGGTFGVVASVTYQTHPPAHMLSAVFAISANNTSAYQRLVAEFTRVNPVMSGSWAGYFTIREPVLSVRYAALNRSLGFENVGGMGALLDYVRRTPGLRVVSYNISLHPHFVSWYEDSMCAYYGSNGCVDEVGINRALVTRLMTGSVLATRYNEVAAGLINLMKTNGTLGQVLGIFVGGGAVARPQVSNAVNPAWRNSLWHITTEAQWSDGAEVSSANSVMSVMSQAINPLRELTPGSGAYLNEADYYEPNWQQSLFGNNYARLLAVKRTYDPNGLFVCWHCVGSERWSNDLDCEISV